MGVKFRLAAGEINPAGRASARRRPCRRGAATTSGLALNAPLATLRQMSAPARRMPWRRARRARLVIAPPASRGPRGGSFRRRRIVPPATGTPTRRGCGRYAFARALPVLPAISPPGSEVVAGGSDSVEPHDQFRFAPVGFGFAGAEQFDPESDSPNSRIACISGRPVPRPAWASMICCANLAR